MRRLILAWIAAALSIGGCVTYHEKTKFVAPTTLFEQVCEVLEVDCSEIAPPIVVISQIIDPYGAHGIYIHGEPYIFINAVTWLPVSEVEIHETAHYVLYEVYGDVEACLSEEVARAVTEILTGVPIDMGWPEAYGCENPYTV